MTIQEVCQRLGKSESTIRRWIRKGKIRVLNLNGVYDISEEQIMQLSTSSQMPSQMTFNDELISQLRSENDYLKERITQLEEARERSDTIILSLSRQLELKSLPKPTWLSRIFQKPI